MISMKRISLIIILLPLLLLPACGESKQDESLVRVKGVTAVTSSDLANEKKRLFESDGLGATIASCQRKISGQPEAISSCRERQKFIAGAALDNLIQRYWLLAEAREDSWRPNREERQLIDGQQPIKRRLAKANIFLDQLAKDVPDRFRPSSREIKDAYRAQPNLFEIAPERRAILISVDREEIANRARRLLTDGESLTAIKKQIKSSGEEIFIDQVIVSPPTTQAGGPGQLLDQRQQYILTSPSNEINGPKKFGNQFIVVKVLSDRPGRKQSFDEARPRVIKLLQDNYRRQQAVFRLLREWKPLTTCAAGTTSRLCSTR